MINGYQISTGSLLRVLSLAAFMGAAYWRLTDVERQNQEIQKTLNVMQQEHITKLENKVTLLTDELHALRDLLYEKRILRNKPVEHSEEEQ